MQRRALLSAMLGGAVLLGITLPGGGPLTAPALAQAPEEPAAREWYRLRLTNEAGGAIELSSTQGEEWMPLGKVTRPATTLGASTGVITVAAPGTVAGATPDHLILRAPSGKTGPRSLRILAKGETENPAAVSTDIPVRGSLFRCLAPPPGSLVRLERPDGLQPMAANYAPKPGDRLVILVSEPAPGPDATITIENKVGGDVVWTTPQNANKVLAKVKQPLKGVGRYKGTERAGAGAVVSWAPSVVLVSTTGVVRRLGPNGEPGEDRGGFVIQPAEPTLHGTTHPASQLLLEAVPEGENKPEVSPFFGLPVPVTNGDPLDLKPTRIEVRVDGGNWEPFPDLRGTIDGEALVKALQDALGGRNIKEGITHLRVVFGSATDAGMRRRFRLATTAAADQLQRGEVTISANVMGNGVNYVQFFLDGVLVQVTNQPPFNWKWNTLRARNGEHLLEIRGLDENLSAVTSVTTKVIVDN